MTAVLSLPPRRPRARRSKRVVNLDDGGLLSREELEAAKAYMRVDGDEDDLVVTGCLAAARAYMEGAGVSLPPAGTPRRDLYDLVCHSIALGLYDHRDAVSESKFAVNPVLQRQLNQLKLTEPVSNLDTEEVGG